MIVPPAPDGSDGGNPGPPAGVILAVTAVLAVAGYFLVMKLHDMSHREDCLMSGRRNCAPIVAPSGQR